MKTKIILSVLITGLIFSSCQKKVEDLQQSANDNSVAESAFNDIYAQVEDSYNSSTQNKNLTSTCAVITIDKPDTTNFPKKVTIDFGSGCTDDRGITRTGKIIADITGKFRESGTVVTVTLENFTRNGNAITGQKTITNNGPNAAGHYVYTINVNDASITTDKGTISWSSSRQREWISGFDTKWPNISDDEFLITGSVSGVNSLDREFSIEITTALNVKRDCKWITAGVVEITSELGQTRKLDYGDGTCDDKATLHVRNKTKEITLRH